MNGFRKSLLVLHLCVRERGGEGRAKTLQVTRE